MPLPDNYEHGRRRGRDFVCHHSMSRTGVETDSEHDPRVCLTCWNCARHCECAGDSRRLRQVRRPKPDG